MNIAELLSRNPNPNEVALIDCSKTPASELSASQITRQMLIFAEWLRQAGFEAGSRVGLLAGNLGEYFTVMFGAPAAGMVFVPLNTRLPEETLKYIAKDADIKMLFCDDDHANFVSDIPTMTIGSKEWIDLMGGSPAESLAQVDPHDVAVQIYTSGSTGRPKGVLLSHENITFTVLEYGSTLPGEVMLVSAPLYHKNASMSSKLAFASGGKVVLLPQFSASAYLDAITSYGVTMCSGVPTMYALITAELHNSSEERDLSSVERVFIGSAPLTEALFDDIQDLFPTAFVTNGYGTTEAVLEFGPHPEGLERPKISLGYEHPDVELKLVDPISGAEGASGELWVKSKGVMLGYHGLPEVNAERLTDGWYHTGDLMKRDSDGWYFFVGRVDDMFVCAGENIYPDAVEQMLERHVEIHQAVVVPVADELKGQLPAAFIRCEADSVLSEAEVKDFALKNGPAYAHPRYVWFVDEIPLASTAKINRSALMRKAANLVNSNGGNS